MNKSAFSLCCLILLFLFNFLIVIGWAAPQIVETEGNYMVISDKGIQVKEGASLDAKRNALENFRFLVESISQKSELNKEQVSAIAFDLIKLEKVLLQNSLPNSNNSGQLIKIKDKFSLNKDLIEKRI